MASDTKWIVGPGVAIITSILASAVAVIAVVVTMIGDVRTDLRDMNGRLDGLDARLCAVEVAFGKVDQRLETLERLQLPTRPAGE